MIASKKNYMKNVLSGYFLCGGGIGDGGIQLVQATFLQKKMKEQPTYPGTKLVLEMRNSGLPNSGSKFVVSQEKEGVLAKWKIEACTFPRPYECAVLYQQNIGDSETALETPSESSFVEPSGKEVQWGLYVSAFSTEEVIGHSLMNIDRLPYECLWKDFSSDSDKCSYAAENSPIRDILVDLKQKVLKKQELRYIKELEKQLLEYEGGQALLQQALLKASQFSNDDDEYIKALEQALEQKKAA